MWPTDEDIPSPLPSFPIDDVAAQDKPNEVRIGPCRNSGTWGSPDAVKVVHRQWAQQEGEQGNGSDRKSTRLNSSHPV